MKTIKVYGTQAGKSIVPLLKAYVQVIGQTMGMGVWVLPRRTYISAKKVIKKENF